jgi:hypothetical protein
MSNADILANLIIERETANGNKFPHSYALGYLQSLLGSIAFKFPEVEEYLSKRIEMTKSMEKE